MDWTRVLQTFIRWGIGFCIASKGFDTLVELKGTSTKLDLDIFVSLLGKNFLVVVICIAIAICSIAWALIERWLKQQVVRKLGNTSKREIQLDPNRSSSNLTPEGKTNPEDA